MSPLGFSDDDVEALSKKKYILGADGAHVQDAFVASDDIAEQVLRMQSLPDKTNQLDLVSGQMPLNDDEYVMDARRFKPSSIGKSITPYLVKIRQKFWASSQTVSSK